MRVVTRMFEKDSKILATTARIANARHACCIHHIPNRQTPDGVGILYGGRKLVS
jgi:hypothetical protein